MPILGWGRRSRIGIDGGSIAQVSLVGKSRKSARKAVNYPFLALGYTAGTKVCEVIGGRT
jgi:hypothetical protein